MTPRVRSTQKLPSVFSLRAAMPRMRAIATEMPTAAETKFCTARPDIWVRMLIASSPEYDCQLVFVVNETAVFQAWSACTGPMPRLSGSHCWSRWSR